MTRPFPLSRAALLVALASPALAQEAVELPPIEIEALRANIEAGAAPGSVEVIDGETVRRQAGGDLAQFITARVGGLTPDNQQMSGASLNLRGRDIQVLINGVPRHSQLRGGLTRDFSLIDPDSIARIEIVKGATSLFGNGATGGLINIITRKAEEPGFSGDLSTRISVQPANIGDSAAADLSIGGQYRGEGWGARLDLAGTAADDRFDGAGRRIPGDALIGQGSGSDMRRFTLSARADAQFAGHEFDATANWTRFRADIDRYADYGTDPISLSADPYDGKPVSDDTRSGSLSWRNRDIGIGDAKVTFFASASERRAALARFDSTVNPLVYAVNATTNLADPDGQTELDTTQIGLRAQISSDVGIATLTYGLDLQRDEVSQTILDGRTIISPMTQNSIAAFVQADIPIGERFDIRAGARWQKFFLEVGDFTRPEIFNPFAGRPGVPLTPFPARAVIGGDFTYEALTFNLGGVYHATEELDVFAGFSQGFSVPDIGGFTRRAGDSDIRNGVARALRGDPGGIAQAFDASDISFASLRPEAQLVNNWEAGLRWEGERARAALSGFYSTSKNGLTFDGFSVSQQKEEIWGLELDAQADLTRALTMGAVLAYTEGRYDEDKDGEIDSWLPNSRIVSPVTATLYADYDFGDGISVGGDLKLAAGRNRPSKANGSRFKLDPMAVVDLRASWDTGRGVLSAGVSNLFDARYNNAAASSVRDRFNVAAEGRRVWLGYALSF